jgi:hypothetical protein
LSIWEYGSGSLGGVTGRLREAEGSGKLCTVPAGDVRTDVPADELSHWDAMCRSSVPRRSIFTPRRKDSDLFPPEITLDALSPA